MKPWRVIAFLAFFLTLAFVSQAQCSICTKTAGQLGEQRASSLNSGIIYLMLTPFMIAGYIGYRWWKTEKNTNEE